MRAIRCMGCSFMVASERRFLHLAERSNSLPNGGFTSILFCFYLRKREVTTQILYFFRLETNSSKSPFFLSVNVRR